MHLPLRARQRLCPTKHQNVLTAFALTGTPEALSDKTSKCLNCIRPYGHAGGSVRQNIKMSQLYAFALYGHAGGSVRQNIKMS